MAKLKGLGVKRLITSAGDCLYKHNISLNRSMISLSCQLHSDALKTKQPNNFGCNISHAGQFYRMTNFHGFNLN